VIKIKRVYDTASKDDGFRILIDGLWPRGLTKEKAKVDLWLKDIAVSPALRKWFSHDPDKWAKFKQRFFFELDSKPDSIALIMDKAKTVGSVTLLYGSKELRYNNAAALLEYINTKQKKKSAS
jgi:uncharacterized protein YeaO (DUF488 family)